MTIAIAAGVGSDGNADVWTAEFNAAEHVVRLTAVTRTDVWERSTDWGTSPVVHRQSRIDRTSFAESPRWTLG